MNHTEFFKSLKEGIAPVYLFYGEEEYVKHSALEQLISAVLPEEALRDVNFSRLDSAVGSEEILRQCETIPFLSEKRLVVVENSPLLKGGESKAGDEDRMLRYLEQPAEFTTLLFLSTEEPDKRKRLFKALIKCACVEFLPLSDNELTKWLEKLLRQGGKTAAPGVLPFLITYTDARPEALVTEMDKLFSFLGTRPELTQQDVTAIVTPGREYNLFRMTDAMLAGRKDTALSLLDGLLRQKEEPIYLLGAISKQYRQLLGIRLYQEAKTPKGEIISAMGLRDFVFTKLSNAGAGFSVEALKTAMDLCYDTDEGLKTGRYFDTVALHRLVIRLCMLKGA